MRIGLNATCFNNRPSGAKQRFLGLYGSLFDQMPEAEFVVFEPKDIEINTWFKNRSNVSFEKTIIPCEGRVQKLFIGLIFWKKYLLDQQLDFFEGFNLPSFSNPCGKTFHTIHDIRGTHKEFSSWEHLISRPAHKKFIAKIDSVITVSETMKNEILNLCPDSNISVIYNGLNYQSFGEVPQNIIENIKTNLKVPREFILSVGHFEERKNYENLIDAIKILKNNGLEVPLVIVGNDNGYRDCIKKKISQQNLGHLVHIYSNLKDIEVQAIYRLCKLFIFPSIYEGFGIPILESMAAKAPLISSNLDVFKEITQNKGIYFDPDSPDDIAQTIKNTLTDSSLLDDIVDYGNNRVKDFGFDSLALQLKNFYIVNK